jgi:flagellar biogenesis protein FliO
MECVVTDHVIFPVATLLWSAEWVDYLKLILILGGILIVAFLTLRFWIPKLARVNRDASGPIQVVARFLLEPNKTLYVLAIGQARMLVASSEAGVQLIQPLAAQDLEQAASNKDEADHENTFERLLQSIKSRRNL